MSAKANGDVRDELIDNYISISSAARDKTAFQSSDDCDVAFNELRNVVELSIMNVEIAHTRYAIDQSNNTLYISEKISEGVFNFFGLKASTGGYTISNLAVSLELSQNSPIAYSADAVMINTYNFLTSNTFGKVAVVSSGDVEYNIHTCKDTLPIVSFTKLTDTTASVQFIAPFEYIIAPGALLTLKIYNMSDREAQVIAGTSPRTVTLLGDFASFTSDDVTAYKSEMIPYSSQSSVSEVAGFGVTDLEISRNTKFELLSMQSPFSDSIEDGVVTPMILVDFPIFVSTADNVVLTGTAGMMTGVNSTIGTTHDDTHFELVVDPYLLLAGDSVVVSSGVSDFDVDEMEIVKTERNDVTVAVTTTGAVSFSEGDVVTFSGLTAPEWESGPEVVVTSVDASTTTFTVLFTYPTSSSFASGETFVTPCNATTSIPTTYLGPNRFDLSRGRRVILCRASVGGKDLGAIHIPNDPTTFFGRIQLSSGADLVNFLGVDQAIGYHKFTSLVKRLHSIRFRFYNEDGSAYSFVGVDYTIFLKVVTMDSNTGL